MIDKIYCESCGRFLGQDFDGQYIELKCGKCGWVTKIDNSNLTEKPKKWYKKGN